MGIYDYGLYEGVMGNELIGTAFEHALMINPEDGLLMVDYNKIDVQFKIQWKLKKKKVVCLSIN